MTITWRPHATDPLRLYASAFAGVDEAYTLDFGGNDVRMMQPGDRPAAKSYTQPGEYLLLARTVETGTITQAHVVVRSHLSPRFSVQAVSARRVRVSIEHPGAPVAHNINWGTDGTWESLGDRLTAEYVYPATPDGPPTITVLDVPAQRSGRKQAPVARRRWPDEMTVQVDGLLRVRPVTTTDAADDEEAAAVEVRP